MLDYNMPSMDYATLRNALDSLNFHLVNVTVSSLSKRHIRNIFLAVTAVTVQVSALWGMGINCSCVSGTLTMTRNQFTLFDTRN